MAGRVEKGKDACQQDCAQVSSHTELTARLDRSNTCEAFLGLLRAIRLALSHKNDSSNAKNSCSLSPVRRVFRLCCSRWYASFRTCFVRMKLRIKRICLYAYYSVVLVIANFCSHFVVFLARTLYYMTMRSLRGRAKKFDLKDARRALTFNFSRYTGAF